MLKKLSFLCFNILLGLSCISSAFGIAPKPFDIAIEGPGALYIGVNGNNEVCFWVLNDSKAKLVQKVSVTKNDPSAVTINIKEGISGVFYADNLPLGKDLSMTFNGEITGTKDCPKCGVMMPLNADSFLPFFTKGGNLAEVEKTQQEIYSVANGINEKLTELGEGFVERQKDSLAEFYLYNKVQSQAGDKKLSGYRDEIVPFEAKIEGKAKSDADKTKQIVEKYSNFVLSFQNIRTNVMNCGKYERNWGFRTQLINALNLQTKNDDDENTADGTDNPRNAIINNFENGFDALNKDSEKCMSNLFGGFLLSGDDANFPGSTPNLSQGNFVSVTDYENLGTQLEDIAARAEKDFDEWQTKLETDTVKFDKLNDYLAIREKSEKIIEPLFKYTSKKVLDDEVSKINLQTVASNNSANITPLGNFTSSITSQPTCNNNTNFTINLNLPIVLGSFWNDKITGGSDTYIILGFGGDDCIYGKNNDEIEFIFAGKGNDLVDGGDYHDFVFGGKNNDTLYGGKGKTYTKVVPAPPGQPITITYDIGNFISGDAGDDTIYGMDNASPTNKSGYADVIIGDGLADDTNSGIDSINGDRGIDVIFGQAKNDILKNTGYGSVKVDGVPVHLGSIFFGNKGNDTIFGTDTPILTQDFTLGDFIFGNQDDDTIAAGQGQDFVFGNTGNDDINGGDGKDYIFGNAGNDVIHVDDGLLNLALGNQGTDSIYGDNGGFNILLGNLDNDFIQGGKKIDLALGNMGDDKVYGGDFFDALFGGQGKDEMKGENGIDAIFGNAEADNIKGGANIDLIFGGDGIDWADGEADTDIIFGNKNLPNDMPRDICTQPDKREKLYGSSGIDLIFGNSGCDEIYGGTEIDALFGGDASDLIKGENDSDLMFGNQGNDKIHGGGYIDIAFGNEDDDEIYGEENSDVLFGNTGKDTILGDDPSANPGGMDFILGGTGNDKLSGQKNADFIFGGDNDDTLEGNEGTDVLFGLNGDDLIFGGTDSDIIFGGDGKDNPLNGEGGSDIVFGGINDDTINGGDDNDLLFGGSGVDSIDDGNGDDLSFGGDGGDYIKAINGANIAFGNQDGDKMCAEGGGEPRDLLFGNKGADTLYGSNYPAVTLPQKDFLFLGQGGQGPKIWDQGCW